MEHKNSVSFQVTGKYALFSDPNTRVGGEKCSYHIPTYEGLKGILQSVYWKPTFYWVIDAVRIMNPIQTETKGIRPIKYNGGNDLSYYTYLKEVCYQVKAHFEWNLNRDELVQDRNENKHYWISKRMINRGGRRDIFLGTRECQGYVEPCVFGDGKGYYDETEELAYGFMYHGITYADEAILPEDKGKMTVRFWRPVMKKGIVTFIPPEKCTIKQQIKEMDIKLFGSDQFSGCKEFCNEYCEEIGREVE
jgi:CRISPR-associated protein Cas5d